MHLGVNHPLGPLALADFIGLDTCLSIMQVLYEGLANPLVARRPCPLLVKYVEAGVAGGKVRARASTTRRGHGFTGSDPLSREIASIRALTWSGTSSCTQCDTPGRRCKHDVRGVFPDILDAGEIEHDVRVAPNHQRRRFDGRELTPPVPGGTPPRIMPRYQFSIARPRLFHWRCCDRISTVSAEKIFRFPATETISLPIAQARLALSSQSGSQGIWNANMYQPLRICRQRR